MGRGLPPNNASLGRLRPFEQWYARTWFMKLRDRVDTGGARRTRTRAAEMHHRHEPTCQVRIWRTKEKRAPWTNTRVRIPASALSVESRGYRQPVSSKATRLVRRLCSSRESSIASSNQSWVVARTENRGWSGSVTHSWSETASRRSRLDCRMLAPSRVRSDRADPSRPSSCPRVSSIFDRFEAWLAP
jgi:hypothetical protein